MDKKTPKKTQTHNVKYRLNVEETTQTQDNNVEQGQKKGRKEKRIKKERKHNRQTNGLCKDGICT